MHRKSISAVPSNEDGSTTSSWLNPPAYLTFLLLQFWFMISWLRKLITVVSLIVISRSLWQIPLCPVSSWLSEPGVRDKGWKNPHFISISCCHRAAKNGGVQTPFRGKATSPSLLKSSKDERGVLCLLQKKKKRSQQKVRKCRVMGMARTPALGPP